MIVGYDRFPLTSAVAVDAEVSKRVFVCRHLDEMVSELRAG
jgi:hypothetical protein